MHRLRRVRGRGRCGRPVRLCALPARRGAERRSGQGIEPWLAARLVRELRVEQLWPWNLVAPGFYQEGIFITRLRC